jgi:hypothetical protein
LKHAVSLSSDSARLGGEQPLVPGRGGYGMLVRMSRYAAARIYTLPESLDELVGPTSGTRTLPRHIDGGPYYEYDLADEADLLLMYERVIREAQSPADLQSHLSANQLRRHWTDLFLPAPARAAWQTRFPELAPAAAAAYLFHRPAPGPVLHPHQRRGRRQPVGHQRLDHLTVRHSALAPPGHTSSTIPATSSRRRNSAATGRAPRRFSTTDVTATSRR